MAIDFHFLVMMVTTSMVMAVRVTVGLRLIIFVMVGHPIAKITALDICLREL